MVRLSGRPDGGKRRRGGSDPQGQQSAHYDCDADVYIQPHREDAVGQPARAPRAVDASTGRERWALIAPEFFSASTKFQRQKDSDTTAIRIKYPSWEALATERKDYFWDGSIGIYQNADNTDIKIFPTMRRGGGGGSP